MSTASNGGKRPDVVMSQFVCVSLIVTCFLVGAICGGALIGYLWTSGV